MAKILKFRQKAFSKERPSKSELESAFGKLPKVVGIGNMLSTSFLEGMGEICLRNNFEK